MGYLRPNREKELAAGRPAGDRIDDEGGGLLSLGTEGEGEGKAIGRTEVAGGERLPPRRRRRQGSGTWGPHRSVLTCLSISFALQDGT
jgi:hypothetical protein